MTQTGIIAELESVSNIPKIALAQIRQMGYTKQGDRPKQRRNRPRHEPSVLDEEDAVDYWERIAHYYDLDQGSLEQDIDFYLALAQRTGSPILELGCGTGRLLLALARAGYRVTGVDILPAMLARAEQKSRAAGPKVTGRIHLLQENFCQLDLDERFRLAILAVNTIMHLESPYEQRALLQCVFRQLSPGGLFALDLFHPHPDALTPANGEVLLEKILTDPESGQQVQKFVARQADYARQVIRTTFMYDAIDDQGQIRRTAWTFPMRYLHYVEAEQMLLEAGFVIEGVYGGYDLESYDDGAERMLFLARRPELSDG